MSGNLLAMVGQVCDELAIPKPTAVAAGTDPQTRRLFGLAKRQLESMSRRYFWQQLTKIGSFTTLGTETQGTLATIATDLDGSRIRQDSMVNRTRKWVVKGPMSPADWQRMETFTVAVYPRFRCYSGQLYILPIPTAGDSVYFEYSTVNFAVSAGGTGKPTFTLDTDTIQLDGDLFMMGLKWRMRSALGQPFAEEMREYEESLFNLSVQDAGGSKTLDAGGMVATNLPSAMVPDGSWNV